MMELFRMEAETHTATLSAGLVALEGTSASPAVIEPLMRAAHSLKGAARIVGLDAAVRVAHAMEDCFITIQEKKQSPSAEVIDALLAGIDLLNRVAQVSDEGLENWEASQLEEVETFLTSLISLSDALGQPPVLIDHPEAPNSENAPEIAKRPQLESTPRLAEPLANTRQSAASDRVLRITSDSLDRLMGLAGEALVTSRSLDDFATDLLRQKRLQHQFGQRPSLPRADQP